MALLPAGLHADGKTVIWNFNDSLTNALGGNYNAFSREPSWARTYLDSGVHLPPRGHALRITVHRAAQGFCGFWANFYPPSGNPPQYFDASPYRYLTFWIKGQKGGGDFDFKLIDQKGERNQDAVPARPLHAYLPRGITPSWQMVWIPLSDFAEVDPRALARIVIIFSQPGDYSFYLDDIGFESVKTPAGMPSSIKRAHQPAHSLTDSRNAMWVWRTLEILTDPAEPGRLFSFCARLNVREIYLSVEFAAPSAGQAPSAITSADGIRRLIEAAHRHGLRVQALAGSPEWAVTAYHPKALGAVEAVLDFNRGSPHEARFDGIHFDVEPYVLIGFEDPAFQQQLLDAYLEMVSECSKAAKAGGLPFSCDVPWWFFPLAGSPNQQEMTVDFAGNRKTVGEHLLDLLNSITIMDYRNQADGAAGIINFAQPAITAAAAQHKTIMVGLETTAEEPTPVDFVLAMPDTDFRSRFAASGLLGARGFHGYILHALGGGGTIFVGLGPPRSQNSQPTEPIGRALGELRQAVGATAGQDLVEPFLKQAGAAVAADPEWTNFESSVFPGPAGSAAIQGFQATNRTAPNITFHGLGSKVFEEEAGSVEEWISREPGFGGLGLHYYGSLQTLMETP
jgi:Carbohydrate binding domain 30